MRSPATYNRSTVSHDDDALTHAIRRQEERLARDPGSLAFAQLADLYRKAGRTREAAALCRDGLARYPHYTTARLILAKALAAEGDLEAALAELTAILEASPNDVQCHRLAAEIHRRRGRLARGTRARHEAGEEARGPALHADAHRLLGPPQARRRVLITALATIVRLATRTDAGAIARIYNQGIGERVATFETEPRTAAKIEAQLAEKGDRFPTVVVEREGGALGA